MSNLIILPPTQAQCWYEALKQAFPLSAVGLPESEIKRRMDRLQADYPHVEIQLTKNDMVVGKRRVFGDRSNCDMYMNDGEPVVQCDTMTAGKLGDAHNGKIIS